MSAETKSRNVFFLSPANLSGRRGNFLVSPKSQFELARKLRAEGATIGEIFSFVSGLYFRGKLAYANAFCEADPATGLPAIFVITATRGLMAPSTVVTLEDLLEMAAVPISSKEPRYRAPLHRDATDLASRMTHHDRIVLLGSVATSKYLEPLNEIFGPRLMIPTAFMGIGDMSRGSLLLRAVRERVPLVYASAPEVKPKANSKPTPAARKRRPARHH